MDLRREAAQGNALYAAIGAALMLYFGFGRDETGISDSDLYNTTVDVATWTMKIGGIALALVAAGCAVGFVPALAADAVVSGLVGLIFAGCGAIWLLTQGDVQGLLFVVFGLMFMSSARHCWQAYSLPRHAAARPVQEAAAVHPASVHPEVLPRDAEPPPEEGYLAALAREKKDPPRADLE